MVENIFRSGLTLFSLEICFFLEYSQLTSQFQPDNLVRIPDVNLARAAVVHLNFRAGSTFPVPVCTVPSSMDWTSRCNKDDAVRVYALDEINHLFLLLIDLLLCCSRKHVFLNSCLGKHHCTSLVWSSGRGYSSIVKLLLEKKAKPEIGDRY